MKIRSRLALTLAALVIPFAIALGLVLREIRHRVVAQTVGQEMLAQMDARRRQRCEQSPERFPARLAARGAARGAGRRRRASRRRFYAFDAATLQSRNPSAPRLSDRMRRQLADGGELGWQLTASSPGRVLVAQRMPWEGPCSLIVVERPLRVETLGASVLTPLSIACSSVLLVLLAAGPLVRRLRRLTRVVHAARREQAPFPAVEAIEGDDELTELARAFAEDRLVLADTIEALRKRDEALTEYIANTTHDVMLPLTVLQGHLIALRDRLAGHAEQPTLERAIEESHYLASLLRNMNAAARLDAQVALTQEPVDLGDVIERVTARNLPVARQRHIALEHATPEQALWVLGDATLLERAIGNVVHNAIRYGDQGGHVAVLLEREVKRFRIEVLDDGPGVSEEELARLGERRHRGAARGRHPSGSGLGLSITKDVMERHGFTVRFERPEVGFRVVFEGALAGPTQPQPNSETKGVIAAR